MVVAEPSRHFLSSPVLRKTNLKTFKSSVTSARTWIQKQRNSAEGPVLLCNRQYINLCKGNWTNMVFYLNLNNVKVMLIISCLTLKLLVQYFVQKHPKLFFSCTSNIFLSCNLLSTWPD